MPMQDHVQLQNRLREFVLATFPLARARRVADDDALFDIGVLDSMGMVDVLLFLQKEFDLKVDGSDLVLENFGSIRSLAQYVARRLEG